MTNSIRERVQATVRAFAFMEVAKDEFADNETASAIDAQQDLAYYISGQAELDLRRLCELG